MSHDENPTVYSTEWEDLGKKKRSRRTPQPQVSLPPEKQTVYLHRESKGRGGKTVTLVKKLQLSPSDLKALSKELKRLCGTGGTTKNGVIEIQGEHRQKIAAYLQNKGYRIKIAGG
ncbi:MAG TPA: translation initiation factor [Chloroflexi bacterium]|nr:translation initiation factor [Chloroflexota bacterium]